MQVSPIEGARLLKEGKIILYPTEAIYGLGIDPLNACACQALRQLKQHTEQGFILVASEFKQIIPWVNWSMLSAAQVMRIRHSWPGHTTWVLPASKAQTSLVQGPQGTIAIRVSEHPVVKQLCELFTGCIVSTSANDINEAPYTAIEMVHKSGILSKVAGIVLGDLGKNPRRSKVIDARTNKILRG